MTMEEFSDGHEFSSYDLPSDRHAWWVGRLVKAKYEILRGLTISNYKSRKIAEGTIGIVVDVHPSDGVLEIMWTTGEKCTASFHDVLSKN